MEDNGVEGVKWDAKEILINFTGIFSHLKTKKLQNLIKIMNWR